MDTAFQVINIHVNANGSGHATQNKAFINATTRKGYRKVIGIFFIAGTQFKYNKNLVFSKPLKIGGEEVIHEQDQSFMFWPKEDNKEFYTVNKPGDGLAITGELYDSGLPVLGYDMQIILKLQK